jgi:hypothetical protein
MKQQRMSVNQQAVNEEDEKQRKKESDETE